MWRLWRPIPILFAVCLLTLSCFKRWNVCALCLELGGGLEGPPKKRFEHIPVRFSPAIHGLRHFWEALPAHLHLTARWHAEKYLLSPGLRRRLLTRNQAPDKHILVFRVADLHIFR